MPLPIGDPSGITAAQPASSSRRASIGSSFVYGSTTKPSFTSSSAASSSSVGSGRSVRSSPITSSFTQSVSKASRASLAVETASRAVKQPAVLGSNEQPASVRTSTIEPRALGSTRLSASVARSAPDARTASPITSRLRKPPVPMTRRDSNSRPAIVRPASATLHRLHDLDALALLERNLVPAPPRHHLAIQRDSHAAALARYANSRHGLAHGGPVAEGAPLAVEHDVHARLPAKANRSGPNGSTASGGDSPQTIAATAAAVIGASSTPLRWWPVAQITPSRGPISGALSGVPGRRRAAAWTNSSSPTSGSTSRAASRSEKTPSAVTLVSKPRSSTVAPTTTSPSGRLTT